MWSEESGSGNQQRVGETALIPILVKAVQELSTKVEEQAKRIEELEG